MKPLTRVLLLFVIFISIELDAQQFTRVFAEGESANGDGQFSLNSFLDEPILSNAGLSTINLDITNSSLGGEGIFQSNGNQLFEIARTGQKISGGTHIIHNLFDDSMVLNHDGRLAFQCEIENSSGIEQEALLVGDGQNLRLVAREDEFIPQFNSSIASVVEFDLNDSNQVVASVSLDNPATDNYIFLSTRLGRRFIVREGASISIDGSNELISLAQEPVLNNAGQVAFRIGSPGDSPIVVLNDHGVNHAIVSDDQAAPDGDGEFASVFSGLAINDSGQVAFSASLSGASTDRGSGIFIGDGNQIYETVRSNDLTPGGQGVLDSLGSNLKLNLNNQGRILFCNEIDMPVGLDLDGLFLASEDELVEIAREDNAIPDGSASFQRFNGYNLNNQNQVAFHADLSDTAKGSTDNEAIYFFDPDMGLVQVIREGDILFGQEVNRINATENNGLFDKRSFLDDNGQITFAYRLDDSSEGIAIWSPNSLVKKLTVDFGNQKNGGIDQAIYSDDKRLAVQIDSRSLAKGNAAVEITCEGCLPSESPNEIRIQVESGCNTTGLQLTVEAWNWTSNEFVNVAVVPESTNEQMRQFSIESDAPLYAQPGTGAIRTRLRWKPIEPVLLFPWEIQLDRISWNQID